MIPPRTVAIILAGGRSKRFGRDKRFEVVDGEPLLHSVVHATAVIVESVIVVIGPAEPAPPLPDDVSTEVQFARDRAADQGPLAGLAAGLEAADGRDVALVVGADMPSLQPDVLRLLLEHAAQPAGPAAWTLEGPDPAIVGPLPLAGRVADLTRAAGNLLERGDRSLRSLVRALEAGRVPAAEWRPLDPDGLTLRDIDRPEDLVG